MFSAGVYGIGKYVSNMAGEPQERAWNKEKIKARIEGNELDLSLCSISKVPVNFIVSITFFYAFIL